MNIEKVLTSEVTNRVVTTDQLLNIHNISLNEWNIEKQIVIVGK
jgi:hypothetical protein